MANGVRLLEEHEYDWWDKFVDISEQGSIFSKSWWLKSVTKGDFKICIYEGDNEILAGIPLTYYSSRFFKMPPLTQSIGFLFLRKDGIRLQKYLTAQKSYMNDMHDYISNKYTRVCINMHPNFNYWSPLYWLNYKQTTRYTFKIDYKNFEEKSYFSSFSKGHKWTLNKVKNKSKLVIKECTNIELFYNEARKTYERQGGEIGYTLKELELIHEQIKNNDCGKMFMIIDENENIHAVNYIVYDEKEAYYWLGSSDPKYRDQGGHTYLIWHVICFFSNKSNLFNFGGSMIESVEKNFRNFSAEPVPYYQVEWFKVTFKNRIFKTFKAALGK